MRPLELWCHNSFAMLQYFIISIIHDTDTGKLLSILFSLHSQPTTSASLSSFPNLTTLSLSLSLLLLWNLRSPLLLLHVRAVPLNMGPHCWSPCTPCETPSMAPFDRIGIQKLVKATAGEMVMLALGWSSPPSISPVKSHWLATESSKPAVNSKPPVKRRDAVGIVKAAEGEKWATGAPGFADLRYLKRSEIW